MQNDNSTLNRFITKYQRVALGLVVLGIVSVILGFVFHPDRTWANILLNSVYFLTLSLCGTFLVALQYVSGSRWSEVLRRLPEAMMSYLPVGGVLLLLIFFGMHSLFHWSHHDAVLHDKILAGKAAYLNVAGFFIRAVVFVGGWTLFAQLLRRNSLHLDQSGDLKFYTRNIKLSAVFMFFFAVTFSLSSVDWLMSVDPHWFSTIFAVYNFSGMFVSGIAVVTILVYLLKAQGLLGEVNDNHYHDLGKYLFAFSTFWAYIWFSQFMLIWYGNIPEETVYYVNRMKQDWAWLFYFNLVLNFIVPFFVLLPRASKRSGAVVMRVAIVLLIGRWLDLYLMVMPGVVKETAFIGITEILIALGFAGVFVYVVLRALGRAPLMPRASVILEYSLHLHQ